MKRSWNLVPLLALSPLVSKAALACGCGPVGYMGQRPDAADWALALGSFMLAFLPVFASLRKGWIGPSEPGQMPLVRPTFLLIQLLLSGVFLVFSVIEWSEGRWFRLDLAMTTSLALFLTAPLCGFAVLTRCARWMWATANGAGSPPLAPLPEAKKAGQDTGGEEEFGAIHGLTPGIIFAQGVKGSGYLIAIYCGIAFLIAVVGG